MTPKIGTIARRNRGGAPAPIRTRQKAAAVPINELSTNRTRAAPTGATGTDVMMIASSSMTNIGAMGVAIVIIIVVGGVVRKVMRGDEIAQREEARNMTKKGGEGEEEEERSDRVHTETHIIPTPRTLQTKVIPLLLRRRPCRRYRTTLIGSKTTGRRRISQKEATRGR